MLHYTKLWLFAGLALPLIGSAGEVPPALSDVHKPNLVLDPAKYNGPDRHLLPVPGACMSDPLGRAPAAYPDTDHPRCMKPGQILAALQEPVGEAA